MFLDWKDLLKSFSYYYHILFGKFSTLRFTKFNYVLLKTAMLQIYENKNKHLMVKIILILKTLMFYLAFSRFVYVNYE